MVLPVSLPDIAIFDMDETLLDHDHVLRAAFTQTLETVGVGQRRSLTRKLSELDAVMHNSRDKWEELVQFMNERHPGLRPRLCELKDIFRSCTLNRAASPLYPGARQFLQTLNMRAVPCHIVSANTQRYINHMVEYHGLASLLVSARSILVEHISPDKATHYADIARAFKAEAGRAPSLWIVGDRAQDFPDAYELKNGLLGVPVDMIAFSEKSQAWTRHPRKDDAGGAYLIKSYPDAHAELGRLAPRCLI